MSLKSFSKKKLVLLSLVVVVLVFLFLIEFPVVSSTESRICASEFINNSVPVPYSPEGLDASSIGMTVWNVQKVKDEKWRRDLDSFSRESDLLVLQEGYATDGFSDFFQEERLYWSMATAFTYRNIEAGVVTGSRVNPAASCALFAKEPILRLPKGIQVNRYAIAGSSEQLVVANVHLVNFALGVEQYRNQLEALKAVLKEHQGPLVVAGDFNSWSADRQRVVQRFSDSLGLLPVKFQEDHRTAFMGYELDHVLLRGVEVNSSKTVAVASSDHNPIMVNFSVK